MGSLVLEIPEERVLRGSCTNPQGGVIGVRGLGGCRNGPEGRTGTDRQRSGAANDAQKIGSRRSSESDDGQVRASMLVAHSQLDVHSGPPLDQHLRPGTRGTTRPAGARLKAGTAICGSLVEVDFVGRPASQRRMRPMLVVPDDEPRQILPKQRGAQGDRDSSSRFDLDGLDEAFHHDDAAVPAHKPQTSGGSLCGGTNP
jgi:hypothetical protein